MSPKEALDLIEKFLPWHSNNSEVDIALKTLRSAVSEQTAHNIQSTPFTCEGCIVESCDMRGKTIKCNGKVV